MTERQKRERMLKIIEELKLYYPEATCALEYGGDPWRLLVMGRLSAQCTDHRVNIVCKELFSKYPTARDMADADIEELENLVRPCGLFRTKADSIKRASEIIEYKYGGRVPDTMDELCALPGVGRKIANLILGDIYSKPAVVCDTHCIRICGRLGFYPESEKNPEKIERILRKYIPENEGSDFCHRIVNFGREVCSARGENCNGCPISHLCDRFLGKKDGKNK